MKTKLPLYSWSEVVVHFTLVAALTAIIQFLYTERPLDYLRIISEDWHGEYATALGFLVFGGCFAVLAWSAREFRKWLWCLVALCGFFVGMEELSWGQRILGISTPSALREANLQGEINLHNLVGLGEIHRIVGMFLLVWGTVSVGLLRRDAQATEARWLDRWGIPLLPLPLAPWFLLTSYHFITYPMVKSDEVGEFLFGISVALLGLYSWLRFRNEGRNTDRNQVGSCPRQRTLLATMLLAAILVGAHVLTLIHNGGLGYRVRLAAERDYPQHEMYAQSDKLFEYLYAHPELMKEDTRIAHARLLRERGESERAREALRSALAELEEQNAERSTVAGLNAEGEVLLLMEDSKEGNRRLEQALALAREKLAELGTEAVDDAAHLLWMMAQSQELQGDEPGARESYRRALEAAPSAELENKIHKWARGLGWQD